MTREEEWLGAIAGMPGVNPPDYPVWHYEQMLAAIYDAVMGASPARAFPPCSWHLDEILYAIYCELAGLEHGTPPPATCRIEEFWLGIYGRLTGDASAAIPTPVWRIEEFLAGVFDAADGWGGTELSGNVPLTLANALAGKIKRLVQYGLCTQASTPTLADPVDIYCNRGVLTASPNLMNASAANTMLGYYIEKATGQIKQASGDSNFMFDAYMPVIGGESYVAYGRTRNGGVLSAYNRIAWYDSNQDWIRGGDYTQNTVTVNTAPANAAYARFSCNPSGTTTTAVTQEIVDSYYWVFQKGTEEPSEVHPYGEIYVVGSPATANLYDASTRLENVHISWAAVGTTQGMCVSAPIPVESPKTYYARLVCGADTNGTQYDRYVVWMTNDEYPSNDNIVERRYIARKSDGLSEGDSKFESAGINNQSVKYVRLAMQMNDTAVMFSEQASAYQPYIEGEAIVISGNGENLVNTATNITGSFINSSGVITEGADAQYTDLIPVTIGNVYKWTLTSNRPSGGNNRWHGYKSDGTWKTQIAYKNPGAGAGIPFELSAAIPAGVAYVRLSYGIDDTDVELREEILQCATAEPLLAVGSVKDEQDIVSGAVTHRCAACVYDGTQPVGDSYISTTGGKDVGAIIVYPLESPVTEAVTAQPLTTAEGTNIIDVTSEVSPIALDVVYKAANNG